MPDNHSPRMGTENHDDDDGDDDGGGQTPGRSYPSREANRLPSGNHACDSRQPDKAITELAGQTTESDRHLCNFLCQNLRPPTIDP